MSGAKNPRPLRRRLTFTLEAPQAQNVSLVGDFNNWDPKRHPMKRKNNGQWYKIVMLQPGTHEYKFWVDDAWVIDRANDYRRRNNFGTLNNLITVSPWP